MFKRTVAILASTAVLALLITPPAQAAGPDKLKGYAAGSSAAALAISLLGQELAFSTTSAAVSSEGPDESTDGPTAAADGAALLLAGTPVPSGAPSQTPGGAAENAACPLSLDLGAITGGAIQGLEVVQVGCVHTNATVTDSAPTASSETNEIRIQVNGLSGDVLDPILTPLVDALTDALTQATDPVIDAVCGLLPAELCNDDGIINLEDAVAELISDIDALDDEAFTVAQIRVAPTLSTAAASADGVVGQAGSTGAFIELFPGLASAINVVTGLVPNADEEDALLTVRLGNATAQVVLDPVDGTPQPDASAAQLASINLDDSLGILDELLGVQVPGLIDTLAEAGNALSCDGGALAPIVCIDLGSVVALDQEQSAARGFPFGEGTVGREATAASVAVLPILAETLGLGDSVLGIQLSQATAAANAVPATPADTPPVDEPDAPLPRTGGDVNVPIALALFAAAAFGFHVVRRTRSA